MGTGRAMVGGFCRAALILVGMVTHGAAAAANLETPACDTARAPRDAFDMQIPFEVIDGRIYVPFVILIDQRSRALAVCR